MRKSGECPNGPVSIRISGRSVDAWTVRADVVRKIGLCGGGGNRCDLVRLDRMGVYADQGGLLSNLHICYHSYILIGISAGTTLHSFEYTTYVQLYEYNINMDRSAFCVCTL